MLSSLVMGERNLSFKWTLLSTRLPEALCQPFCSLALAEPLVWLPQKLRRKWYLVKIRGQELFPYSTCFK